MHTNRRDARTRTRAPIGLQVCCAGHPETVTNDPNYIQLFGKQVASTLAVYHHHHDHDHDASGNVVSLSDADQEVKTRPGERDGHHG